MSKDNNITYNKKLIFKILKTLDEKPKSIDEIVHGMRVRGFFTFMNRKESGIFVKSLLDNCGFPYLKKRGDGYYLTGIIDLLLDEYIVRENIELPLSSDVR